VQSGEFRVRGTVRSKTNAAKIDPLKRLLGDLFSQVELVEADLLNEQSIREAFTGSTFVAHTASPFIQGYKGPEDDILKPAIEGTKTVMKVCAEVGVKRVVVTSSIASMKAVNPANRPPGDKFDETIWSDPGRPGGLQPYTRSKTLAEMAAWECQKATPELELVTINPGFIMGPTENTEAFTSGLFLKRILTGGMEKCGRVMLSVVDVRDVALAHVKAITVKEAAGNRFIVCNTSLWMKDVADILAEKYLADGWPIPTEEIPNADAEQNWFDNTRSQEVLGITYRPLKDSFIDMCESMIKTGFVTKPTK